MSQSFCLCEHPAETHTDGGYCSSDVEGGVCGCDRFVEPDAIKSLLNDFEPSIDAAIADAPKRDYAAAPPYGLRELSDETKPTE